MRERGRVALESRYAVHSTSGIPSLIFPAVGTPRRVLLVVGHDLGVEVRQDLTTVGYTVHAVRTDDEAHAFLADRIPAAIIVTLARPRERLDLVRWVRQRDRLAFVPVMLTPAGISIDEAIRDGADDVFDVAFGDASERICARIARASTLAQLALLDPLTQLHNRRFMNDRLQSEVSRAKRFGTIFSVALVDLDDFKTINDTFGHTAGDRALVAFARALRYGLRAYDVPCRFGGDEFVVLFPDESAAGAEVALDNLRKQADWHVSGLPTVTLSAGIAEFPKDGDTWMALFEVADHNALCAKNGGKNRTFTGLHP